MLLAPYDSLKLDSCGGLRRCFLKGPFHKGCVTVAVYQADSHGKLNARK